MARPALATADNRSEVSVASLQDMPRRGELPIRPYRRAQRRDVSHTLLFRLALILALAVTLLLSGALALGAGMDTDALTFAASYPTDSLLRIFLVDTARGRLVSITPRQAHGYMPAWSPDGAQLAYTTRMERRSTLMLRDIAMRQTRILSDSTYDAHSAMWSPDGAYIAYTLCCGGDDVAVVDLNRGQMRAFEFGISTADRPYWLADSSAIAVTAQIGSPRFKIAIQPLDGSPYAHVGRQIANNLSPRPSPDGHSLLYVSIMDGMPEIFMLAEDGSSRNLTVHEATDDMPVWSPDGTRIAFMSERESVAHIYVMDPSGGNKRRLTRGSTWNIAPVWSLDGRQIAFLRRERGETALYVMNADGSSPRRLTFGLSFHTQSGVSWWPALS